MQQKIKYLLAFVLLSVASLAAAEQVAHNKTQTFVFESHEQAGHTPKVVAYYNGKPLDQKTIKEYSDNIVVQYKKKLGQQQPEIVAYENGKKLTPEQSKALLKRIETEQAAMQAHFVKMQQNMQEMFQQSMQDFQKMQKDLGQPFIVPLEPGPVILPNQQQKKVKAITKDKKQPLVPNPFK